MSSRSSETLRSRVFESHGHTVELEDVEDSSRSSRSSGYSGYDDDASRDASGEDDEDGDSPACTPVSETSAAAEASAAASMASGVGISGSHLGGPLAWPSPAQLESRAMLMGAQGDALWTQLEQTLNDRFVAQLQERIHSFRTGILVLLDSKRKRVGPHGQTILTFLQSELDNAEGLVEERLSATHLCFRDRLREIIHEWESQCDDHMDDMQQEILVRIYPLPPVRPASACSSHSPSGSGSNNNNNTIRCGTGGASEQHPPNDNVPRQCPTSPTTTTTVERVERIAINAPLSSSSSPPL
jgi:hypothetical protein